MTVIANRDMKASGRARQHSQRQHRWRRQRRVSPPASARSLAGLSGLIALVLVLQSASLSVADGGRTLGNRETGQAGGRLGRAVTVSAASQLELGDNAFDWTTTDDDRAYFEWWADVVNAGAQPVEVEVTLDLLDDNDDIVHSDPVRIELRADQRRRVRQTGSLPYDTAANVVSHRLRLERMPTGDS